MHAQPTHETYRSDLGTVIVTVRPRTMGGYRVRMASSHRVIVIRTWRDGVDRIECYRVRAGLEEYAGDLRDMADADERSRFAYLYSFGAHRV